MAEEMKTPREKIGAGHAEAMFRAGLKELAQALPAFPESVRPVEEPGLVGNPTPQEVVRDKQSYDAMLAGFTARGVVNDREQDRGVER